MTRGLQNDKIPYFCFLCLPHNKQGLAKSRRAAHARTQAPPADAPPGSDQLWEPGSGMREDIAQTHTAAAQPQRPEDRGDFRSQALSGPLVQQWCAKITMLLPVGALSPNKKYRDDLPCLSLLKL